MRRRINVTRSEKFSGLKSARTYSLLMNLVRPRYLCLTDCVLIFRTHRRIRSGQTSQSGWSEYNKKNAAWYEQYFRMCGESECQSCIRPARLTQKYVKFDVIFFKQLSGGRSTTWLLSAVEAAKVWSQENLDRSTVYGRRFMRQFENSTCVNECSNQGTCIFGQCGQRFGWPWTTYVSAKMTFRMIIFCSLSDRYVALELLTIDKYWQFDVLRSLACFTASRCVEWKAVLILHAACYIANFLAESSSCPCNMEWGVCPILILFTAVLACVRPCCQKYAKVWNPPFNAHSFTLVMQ